MSPCHAAEAADIQLRVATAGSLYFQTSIACVIGSVIVAAIVLIADSSARAVEPVALEGGFQREIQSLFVSPDGAVIAQIGNSNLRTWNRHSQALVGRYQTASPISAHYGFTKDSQHLFVSESIKSETDPLSYVVKSQLLDAKTMQTVRTFGEFGPVAISPDGKLLAAYRPSQGMELYDATTWQRIDREPMLAVDGTTTTNRLVKAVFSCT